MDTGTIDEEDLVFRDVGLVKVPDLLNPLTNLIQFLL